MTEARYAIIVGMGRSGTNWLLELLNLSSQTYCRNEPYACLESPLRKLEHDRFVEHPDISALAKHWDNAIDHTLMSMGFRDPVVTATKDFHHSLSRQAGLYRLLRSTKFRKLISPVLPSLRGEEWLAPGWVFDREKLRNAKGVVKFTRSTGWVSFVLKHRRDVPVFHITRHPGGFLNSWANRYLSTTTSEDALQGKLEHLHDLVTTSSHWRAMIGDVAQLDIESAHLWYWLYMNRTVFEAGRDNPNYRHVHYEDLARFPVETMRPLFDAYQLEWNDDIEQQISELGNKSKFISNAWKNKLTPRQIDIALSFTEMANDFYQPAA